MEDDELPEDFFLLLDGEVRLSELELELELLLVLILALRRTRPAPESSLELLELLELLDSSDGDDGSLLDEGSLLLDDDTFDVCFFLAFVFLLSRSFLDLEDLLLRLDSSR